MAANAGIRHGTSETAGRKECGDNYILAAHLAYCIPPMNWVPLASSFQLKVNHKPVQIVDSNKITCMIRCAWNASSMHAASSIVPQLHYDTVL